MTRDLVPPLLLSSMLVVGMVFIGLFLLCIKRFEVALLLISVSTWVSCFFVRNVSAAAAEPESNLGTYIRLALVAMVGLVGYLRFVQTGRGNREKVPLHLTLLGVFLLFALFTTTYSISPSFTFVRVLDFLAFYGFLLEFHYWMDDEAHVDRALNVLFIVTGVGMVVNLSSLFLWRSHVWYVESPNRFQGVMAGPNGLGAVLMASYVIFMWKFMVSDTRGRMWSVFFFLIAFFMHVLSGSRSSIASAVAGFVIWAIVMKQTKILAVLLIVIASGCIVIFSGALPSLKRDQGEQGSITDLTGRTDIWGKSIEVLKQRPLQGYGYQVGGAIFTRLRLSSADYFLSENATARFQLHNGYLSVAVGCGIPCLLLWVVILLLPLRQAFSLPVSPYKALGIAMIIQCVMLNCVEDFVSLASRSMPSMFFWIGWVICGRMAFLQHNALSHKETGLQEGTA